MQMPCVGDDDTFNRVALRLGAVHDLKKLSDKIAIRMRACAEQKLAYGPEYSSIEGNYSRAYGQLSHLAVVSAQIVYRQISAYLGNRD
jgi:hypothetical protein